jgi:histidinol-phosphatase (PHP family)
MIHLLPDYHIHTKLCNHAYGEVEDYIEYAINLGLKEIGFADHMPVMLEPQLCMSYKQLPEYIEKIHEVQERYKGLITIKLGCEMDIVNERSEEIRKIIKDYPFDYVIGSIHYLDGWPFDQVQYQEVFTSKDIDSIYDRFFTVMCEAIMTGLYDIAGHIDNIKRMGYRPQGSLDNYYVKVAESLKSMNMSCEVNTGGFDNPCGEAYPSLEFLRVLHSYDIPVTFGSDAHRPHHVGRYFDRALLMLQEVGYDNVVVFDKRVRRKIPISPSGTTP